MTDAEKIEWFDLTMEWVDQWGSSAAAIEAGECSGDAPYDLFFDVVEQYKKVTGK